MLNAQQFRQRHILLQLCSMLLLASFVLLLGSNYPLQSNTLKHHFDASFSTLTLEIEAETEEETQDNPLTPHNALLTQTQYLKADAFTEQLYEQTFSSLNYTQPPTRAPPTV